MACVRLDDGPCPLVETYGDERGLWAANFKSARIIEVVHSTSVGKSASLADLLTLLVPARQRTWRLDHVISASETWVHERGKAAEAYRDHEQRKQASKARRTKSKRAR